jgi:beta-lactamase class D
MKRLKRKETNRHIRDFGEDIKRIVEVFAARGYEVSEEDACWAWEQHSDSWAAGWLGLGEKDEYVFQHAIDYLMEEE